MALSCRKKSPKEARPTHEVPDGITQRLTEMDHRMLHLLSRGLLVRDGRNAKVLWARDHGTLFVTTSLPREGARTEPLKVVYEVMAV